MAQRAEDDTDTSWEERSWAIAGEDRPGMRLRPLAIVAACGLALAGLVLVTGRGTDATASAPPEVTTSAGQDVGGATTGDPSPLDAPHPPEPAVPGDAYGNGGQSGFTITELQGDWRSTPGIRAAESVAMLVARSWLSTSAADLDISGLSTSQIGGWVEQLAVEATEQLDPHLVVVTLVATVYDNDADVVRQLRLGVPVRLGREQANVAGEPWLLPELPLDLEPPATDPVDDHHHLDAAYAALIGAGYTDVEIQSLERTDSWPWRAHVSARTAHGYEVATPVLLRRHLDGFVVAGTVLHPATPASSPHEDDAGAEVDR